MNTIRCILASLLLCALLDGQAAAQEEKSQPTSPDIVKIERLMKALRKSGIHVVAIHQHMVGESPRMMFLHYWGMGRTVDLARGLKSALETQKS